jgi:hypothetical protein
MAHGIRIGDSCDFDISVEQVSAFYGENWPRRIALALPSFYRWQFAESPDANGRDHCCVAIGEDGGIVGVMGLHPQKFRLDGECRHGAALTTWVASRKGVGIGARMLEHLQNRYDVLLGTGITAAALPLYLAAGFRYVASIPRFLKVFRPETIETFGASDRLGRKLMRYWAPRDSFSGRVAEVSDWSGAAGVVAEALDGANHYARSASHLEWRFCRHPVFPYRCFIVESDAGRAFVVLKIEILPEFSIANVVECCADDRMMPTAIEFIESYCLHHAVDVADFYCTSTRHGGWFMKKQWFSILDDKALQFPHLFYPVELRSPPTTSLIAWSRGDALGLLDIGKLYLTKADLDLDRPTLAYYQAHGLREK